MPMEPSAKKFLKISLFRDAVILVIVTPLRKQQRDFCFLFSNTFLVIFFTQGLLLPVLLFVPRLTDCCILSVHQEKCHQYWPAERSARYQYFVVDPMAEYNMPQYILREFKVTDARVRRQNLGPYCDLCVTVHVQSESICVQESNSLNAFILINALTRTVLPFYICLCLLRCLSWIYKITKEWRTL